ncbi:hypothetical protein HNY73_016512 [Argiope bruennichi]|uniref:Uncharacterized protein n=1 Tax=Argiope bruennichi TaxID=94029 RepID=A0A8T0EJ08_ARGBR|nr:hypothetical protein HNY73_016512 [Argiope bruennichi]
METSELIRILADLAKSEDLYVESPKNDTAETPCTGSSLKGGGRSIGDDNEVPNSNYSNAVLEAKSRPVLETRKAHAEGLMLWSDGEENEVPNLFKTVLEAKSRPALETRNANATFWGAVTGFVWNAVSRVFQYVTGNYAVTAKVQLIPVSDLLRRLEEPHRRRLTDRMRIIMNEHSIVDLNTLNTH